jgi:hypothetical protein
LPDAVTITALLSFALSVQPRSKHRFVSAAPTAPAMCGRRSVQSRHGRQNSRPVEFSAKKVDSEPGEKSGARLRDFSGFFAEHDVLVRREEVGQVDAETAGKVVVADSGRAKLACLTRHRAVSRSVFERKGDDALDHLYDFRRCEPEIPMSSLSDDPHQARVGQLGEMRARGLRGDPRRVGKLAGGLGSAIEKRREHRGSCRLPDERRYLRNEIARNHLPSIAPESVGRADEHFDSDRSGLTLIRSPDKPSVRQSVA